MKIKLDFTKARLENQKAELEKQKAVLRKVTEGVEKLEKDYKMDEESFARVQSELMSISKGHQRLQYSRTVKLDILGDYEKPPQFPFPFRH